MAFEEHPSKSLLLSRCLDGIDILNANESPDVHVVMVGCVFRGWHTRSTLWTDNVGRKC